MISAAERGHLNSLLATGADVEIRDGEDYTAYKRAAKREHAEVLKAILVHADHANADGEDGGTTLVHAADQDQAGAIDLLIEAGAGKDSRGGRLLSCCMLYLVRGSACPLAPWSKR